MDPRGRGLLHVPGHGGSGCGDWAAQHRVLWVHPSHHTLYWVRRGADVVQRLLLGTHGLTGDGRCYSPRYLAATRGCCGGGGRERPRCSCGVTLASRRSALKRLGVIRTVRVRHRRRSYRHPLVLLLGPVVSGHGRPDGRVVLEGGGLDDVVRADGGGRPDGALALRPRGDLSVHAVLPRVEDRAHQQRLDVNPRLLVRRQRGARHCHPRDRDRRLRLDVRRPWYSLLRRFLLSRQPVLVDAI